VTRGSAATGNTSSAVTPLVAEEKTAELGEAFLSA